MRWTPYIAAAAVMQLPAVVFAQQVVVSGWVDSVDMTHSTLTIRTLAKPRTIQVSPDAVIRINGTAFPLNRLPRNAAITITAQAGANGVLRATQVSARTSTPQPAAAAPAGSVVRGTLVGMNIPANTITVRTTSGDNTVSLGSAPILVNGGRGSTRNLQVGQAIQVERSLPTEASTEFVTQQVRVLSTPRTVASSRTTRNGAVRSRTSGYRSKYRSRRSRRSGRARYRVRGMRQSATSPSFSAAPGTAALAPGVTTLFPYVPGGIVAAPVLGDATIITGASGTVVAPGVGGGAAPVTTTADPRFQAGATAGTADPRQQAGTGGTGFVDRGTALPAPAATFADPRLQAGTAGAVGPRNQAPLAPGAAGTVPGTAGVADPRNQGPLAPGVVDPRNQSLAVPIGPNVRQQAPLLGGPGLPAGMNRGVLPRVTGFRGPVAPRIAAPRPAAR